MSTLTQMVYPTIHLNGTSREELQRQLREAYSAIGKAMEALNQCAPHGRDYYTQGAGVINIAIAEYRDRLKRLESVQAELFAIWEHIQ